jgi:hypothetical protein
MLVRSSLQANKTLHGLFNTEHINTAFTHPCKNILTACLYSLQRRLGTDLSEDILLYFLKKSASAINNQLKPLESQYLSHS